VRLKTAEEVARQKKLEDGNREVLKAILGGSLGIGAGTAAGYLGMRGADAVSRHLTGHGIPADSIGRLIVPMASGGLGMALGSWQAHQQELMNRGRKNH
jgi:hypothetical protein